MAKKTAQEKQWERDRKRWQAEDDARTLKASAELSANPARMKAAAGILKKEQAAINRAIPKAAPTGGKKK